MFFEIYLTRENTPLYAVLSVLHPMSVASHVNNLIYQKKCPTITVGHFYLS